MTTWEVSQGDAGTGAASPLIDVSLSWMFDVAEQGCVSPTVRRAGSWRSRLKCGGALDEASATVESEGLILGTRPGENDTVGLTGVMV